MYHCSNVVNVHTALHRWGMYTSVTGGEVEGMLIWKFVTGVELLVHGISLEQKYKQDQRKY